MKAPCPWASARPSKPAHLPRWVAPSPSLFLRPCPRSPPNLPRRQRRYRCRGEDKDASIGALASAEIFSPSPTSPFSLSLSFVLERRPTRSPPCLARPHRHRAPSASPTSPTAPPTSSTSSPPSGSSPAPPHPRDRAPPRPRPLSIAAAVRIR